MARTTQRDAMGELDRRFGGNNDKVVAAYAAAERRGDAMQASHVHDTEPEVYAEALYRDGVTKGWIR